MSFVGKSSAALICLGVLGPVAFAQKNVVKVAKTVVTKPAVVQPRPPLLSAGKVPPLALQLQQNFMRDWDLALGTPLERSVARQHQKATSILTVTLKQRRQYVAERIQPVKDFLATHQNNWPQYGKSKQDDDMLRYISNFMEAEDPTPQVLGLQREIIRLRAQSNARSPYEVASIVGSMMEYGLIPHRAKTGNPKQNEDVELVNLGEDLAFAMAAFRVSMKNNPWKKISGFARIVDIATTYKAVSRQDLLLGGIPEMYEGEGGIHYPNIPLLTKNQYLVKQYRFATEHPFEFVLAPFWEKVFGYSFYRSFKYLSPVEKQALLFNAPQLPKSVKVLSDVFATCYDNAVRSWVEQNKREPNSYVGVWREEELADFLTRSTPTRSWFRFRENNEPKLFMDLSIPHQVEVLMWIWKNLNISPVRALERLTADKRDFF